VFAALAKNDAAARRFGFVSPGTAARAARWSDFGAGAGGSREKGK
jgi:hypothetical protein